ncbi:MAG: hypothetical protein ACI9U2_000817 [Bradymonadia bacterium]|jgi:hypothetical protein
MSKTSEEDKVRQLLAPVRAHQPRLKPDRQAAIWAQIEAHRTRASHTRPWRIAFAAAAVLAVGGAATWMMQSSVAHRDAARLAATSIATNAQSARPKLPLDRVVDCSVTLPSGAQLDVTGEVRVVSATETITALTLTRGAVTSRVPTLPAAGRFVIETPTAEVEVKGTVFRVALRGTTATEVVVDEGRVEVRAHDARQPRGVDAGQTVIIEPTTRDGAQRAEARGDLVQAFDIRRALLEQLPDDLTRRNRLLSLGHAIDERATGFAVAYWQRVEALHQSGVHADEFAWRHASALRAAGRLDTAREAAARYRQRFSDSPRAAETRSW